MAVIGLEDDIGFAALLFTLFIGLLWIATGRVGYLVLGFVLFAGGAYVAARYFGQVHVRVSEWLNPWQTATNPNPGGCQLRLGWYGFGSRRPRRHRAGPGPLRRARSRCSPPT